MKHMYKSFFLSQFMPNLPYTKSCPKQKLFSRPRSWQILSTYSTQALAPYAFSIQKVAHHLEPRSLPLEKAKT